MRFVKYRFLDFMGTTPLLFSVYIYGTFSFVGQSQQTKKEVAKSNLGLPAIRKASGSSGSHGMATAMAMTMALGASFAWSEVLRGDFLW